MIKYRIQKYKVRLVKERYTERNGFGFSVSLAAIDSDWSRRGAGVSRFFRSSSV